jgi:hypothetical protein
MSSCTPSSQSTTAGTSAQPAASSRVERFDRDAMGLAPFRRQLVDVLWRHGAAVDDGQHDDAHRCHLERHATVRGVPLELREDVLAPAIQRVVEALMAIAIAVALERLRELPAGVAHERGGALAELRAAPRRQYEGARALRGGKVVDVSDVGWCGSRGRGAAQEGLGDAAPAGPGGTGDEHVAIEALAIERERERGDGARLPDDLVERLDLGRGVEVETRGVTGQAE